jgi:drug/metabolite transporter (DMT)-like permease
MSESRPAAERRAETLPPAGFVLLAALSLFWGLNWPAMKLALTEVPVWPLRSLCLIVGGGALLAISAAGGRSLRIATGDFRPLIVCTLFNVVGWQLFSGYGVSLMEAGRASIIAFTMPVWAALLGGFILGEHTPLRRWAALALGMAGLAILMGPDLFKVGKSPLGALMMLGAAISWAIGTVLLKRTAWSLPTAALTGWQLMLAAVPITIGAVILGDAPDPSSLSPRAIGATLYIILVPMIFCHWAWFKVVALFPTAIAAIGTLAIPVVGVLSSALILGEPFGPREILALALVSAALVMVLLLPALRPGGAKPR